MSAISKYTSLFSLAGVAGLVLIATALPSKADSSDGNATLIVRDHRQGPVVRDHRHPVGPVVRDHRGNGGSAQGGVTVTNTPVTNTPTKDKSGGGHQICGQTIFGGPKVCVSY